MVVRIARCVLPLPVAPSTIANLHLLSCVSLWSKTFVAKVYCFMFFTITCEEGSECSSAECIYSVDHDLKVVVKHLSKEEL